MSLTRRETLWLGFVGWVFGHIPGLRHAGAATVRPGFLTAPQRATLAAAVDHRRL